MRHYVVGCRGHGQAAAAVVTAGALREHRTSVAAATINLGCHVWRDLVHCTTRPGAVQ